MTAMKSLGRHQQGCGQSGELEWRFMMLNKVIAAVCYLSFFFRGRIVMPPETPESELIKCQLSLKCKYANLLYGYTAC